MTVFYPWEFFIHLYHIHDDQSFEYGPFALCERTDPASLSIELRQFEIVDYLSRRWWIWPAHIRRGVGFNLVACGSNSCFTFLVSRAAYPSATSGQEQWSLAYGNFSGGIWLRFSRNTVASQSIRWARRGSGSSDVDGNWCWSSQGL